MSDIGLASLGATANRSLRALVVDDESVIRGPLALCLETLGHRVQEAATVEDAIASATNGPLDVALVDLRLGTASGLDLMTQLLALQPRLKIIIITAHASVDVAVRAMSRGAADFLCKPFTPQQVAATVARAAALRTLESDVGIISDHSGTAGPEADFATTSADLQRVVITARRVAPTATPILLSGESGAGKTVLARAIHGWGKQPEGPFLAVDCAAHSPAFVTLAIFGDTLSGDQTITSGDIPLLLRAAGGTLLIKHVDSLSPATQERLARVLETRTLEGGDPSTPRPCDCRVIATTAIAPDPAAAGRLWPLLERIHLALPALRERAHDVPQLAQRYLAFIRQQGEKQVLGFSLEAVDRLVGYEWPGNLRELHRVVSAAFDVCDGPHIEVRHLAEAIRSSRVRRLPRAGDPISLEELEAAHIREVIAAKPSFQDAATVLGIDLQALYRRRKQFGI